MASSSSFRLLLLVTALLAICIAGARARPGVHFHPCKTFIISSSSFTFSTFKPLPSQPQDQFPSDLLAFVAQIDTQFQQKSQPQLGMLRPRHPYLLSNGIQLRFPRYLPHDANPIPHHHHHHHHQEEERSFGVTNSLRERTKDILSVVVALLFGVGCGALTSATMYLVWSLVTNRYEPAHDDDDDFYADDVSPKKLGYTIISSTPAAESAPLPAPAKQVV